MDHSIVFSLCFLPGIFPLEAQRELDDLAQSLAQFDDEALWTVARAQMPVEQQERLQVLMDANTQGTLGEGQWAELAGLVEQGQRLSALKAQAAALLTERGHRVTIASLTAPHG